MAVEAAVDFLHNGCRQAAVGHHYDGVKSMRAGAQFAALGRCEF